MGSVKFKNITGIILGSRDSGDNDKVFVIFSPEVGKINLVGYGANRFKNRFAGKANISNVVRCLIRYPSSIDKMISMEEIEVIADFFSFFRGNLLKMSYASYIGEVINITVPQEVFDSYVYNLAIKCLYDLSRTEDEIDIMKNSISFSVGIIKNMGVMPYIKGERISIPSKKVLLSVLANKDFNIEKKTALEIFEWIESKILEGIPTKNIVSLSLMKDYISRTL